MTKQQFNLLLNIALGEHKYTRQSQMSGPMFSDFHPITGKSEPGGIYLHGSIGITSSIGSFMSYILKTIATGDNPHVFAFHVIGNMVCAEAHLVFPNDGYCIEVSEKHFVTGMTTNSGEGSHGCEMMENFAVALAGIYPMKIEWVHHSDTNAYGNIEEAYRKCAAPDPDEDEE